MQPHVVGMWSSVIVRKWPSKVGRVTDTSIVVLFPHRLWS